MYKSKKKVYNILMKKKLRLIYTHTAGNGSFKTELDTVISILSPKYDISIFRANNLTEIKFFMQTIKPNEYDVIASAGGDGTLNVVAGSIVKNGLNSVLGIIPAGTSNDFARKIGISRAFSSAAETILNGSIKEVDVGFVGHGDLAMSQYSTFDLRDYEKKEFFINVFGIGTLTNVSNYVKQQAKSTLGNMAYYFKGIEKLQKLEPMKLKITTTNRVYEDEFLFALALNTGAAGGFDKLVRRAKIDDGKLDFIAIKDKGPTTLPTLLVRLMMDEHLTDERIIYFRDSYVKIESLENKDSYETNIDGEKGPEKLPLEIIVGHKKLKIFEVL